MGDGGLAAMSRASAGFLGGAAGFNKFEGAKTPVPG